MKTYILGIILMVSTLHVFSQKKSKKGVKKKDSISEVINIVTSYTPTISDAFKVKKNPKIIVSENTKKKA
jgi:predicted membrane channel-forming protein YqfA (hemolysin III family)